MKDNPPKQPRSITDWYTYSLLIGFYISLGFGIVVIIGILICVGVDTDKKKSLVPCRQRWAMLYSNVDVVGFCLLALGTTTLVVALQSGGRVYPWNSTMIITLLCCAAFSCLLFAGWVWYRGDAALIPTTLFKNRIVVVACYMSMAINTTSSLISYWMPIYFQAVLEKGPLDSAISTLPTILSCFIVGIATGHLSEWTGPLFKRGFSRMAAHPKLPSSWQSWLLPTLCSLRWRSCCRCSESTRDT